MSAKNENEDRKKKSNVEIDVCASDDINLRDNQNRKYGAEQ